MGNLAIIPARGGSKRIPKKNIKNFFGKPIVAYSIETALASKLFEEVMVSTDDQEIAEISKTYGAEVPFMRNKENSDDYAGTAEVLLEVIEKYKEQGKIYGTACCLYPTAPFITINKIIKSYQLFQVKNYDSVFPVVQYSYPIQRSLKLNSEEKVSMFFPENYTKRSQDLETAYHDAGQFYWIRPDIIRLERKLWTNNSGVVIYPESEVQDIDNEMDWKLAELKYELIQSSR